MLFQRLIFATMCLGLLTFSAYGGAELEQRIPADSLVVATWAGKGIVFDGSMLGQSLNKLRPLELLKLVSSNTAGPQTPEMISLFTNIAAHPCALAITDLHRKQGAGIIFLSDLGKDAKLVLKKIKAAIPPKKLKAVQISGVEFTRAEGGAYFGLLPGTNILIGGSNTQVIAQTMTQDPEKSFVASPMKTKYILPLSEKNGFLQASLLINKKALDIKLNGILSKNDWAEYQKVMLGLGLEKAEAFAWTLQFHNKQTLSTARIYSPGPHRGVLAMMAGPALTPAQLATVPADADFFVAVNLPAETVWKEMMNMLRQTAGPQRQQRAEKEINAAFEKMELSLQKNVLDAIGDTWLLSSAVSQGGWITGTVLSVDIKNPTAFGQLQTRMEGLLGGAAIALAPNNKEFVSPIRTLKVGQTIIRYYQDSRLMLVSPAWMVYKNRFYLAAWPQVLQAVIENKTPALANRPAFNKQWKTALPQPCSMMGYINTPMMNRDLYPFALLLKTAVKNALIQKNPGSAKALADLTLVGSIQEETTRTIPYFFGVCPDEKGVTFRSYGSGGETQLLLPVVLGAFTQVQLSGEKRYVEFNMEVKSNPSKLSTTQPSKSRSSKPNRPEVMRYYCLETKKIFTLDPSIAKTPEEKMDPEMPIVCKNSKCKTDLNEWYREQRKKRRRK